MINTYILKILLLIGILFNSLAACKRTGPELFIDEAVIRNKTDYRLKIVSFVTINDVLTEETRQMKPYDSITFDLRGRQKARIPLRELMFSVDSTYVYFGDAKQMLLNRDKVLESVGIVTLSPDNHFRHIYEITDEHYQQAEPMNKN